MVYKKHNSYGDFHIELMVTHRYKPLGNNCIYYLPMSMNDNNLKNNKISRNVKLKHNNCFVINLI